jgi:uncharacterized protein YigA (DUF484 family)
MMAGPGPERSPFTDHLPSAQNVRLAALHLELSRLREQVRGLEQSNAALAAEALQSEQELRRLMDLQVVLMDDCAAHCRARRKLEEEVAVLRVALLPVDVVNANPNAEAPPW